MASKIKVDTIENVAGSGNVSLGSGHNLVVPGNITGQGTAAITSNATVGGTLGVTSHLTAGGEVRTTNINTASSAGTLVMYGGATNKGGTIELSGGNNTGATGSGIVFKTGASTSNPSEKMRISSSGNVTMPSQPCWELTGRTSSTTPAINNSAVFQFAATTFAQGGVTVSNTFSRVTVPTAGKYYMRIHIQHAGPGANTEARYMTHSIKKNGTIVKQHLDAMVAVQDGWGAGNSYHTGGIDAFLNLAANDYLELVVSRSSSSDWNGTIYDDSGMHTVFYGYLLG